MSDDQHAKIVNDKRLRRLTTPAQMAPRLRSRQIHIATWILSTALAGYVVLFADFGPHEHCFSPLRRWFDTKRNAFWTLSPQEEQDLKETGKL